MKLATPCLCLIAFISFLKPCNGKAIKSFHLNKEFDILNPICDSCPDPECVIYKDESASIPFPREMTACFRTQPMSYITSWRYSTSMSFGTLLPDFSDMDEGFFYGIPFVGDASLQSCVPTWRRATSSWCGRRMELR